MKTPARGGRLFEPALEALARSTDAGVQLRAPAVGTWRPAAPLPPLTPGAPIGELEILGVLHRVVVPQGVAGVAIDFDPRHGEIAVAYGEVMLVVDPEGAVAARGEPVASSNAASSGERGLVFDSPLAGRFYARPAPDKPTFVTPGDIVSTGQTVGLLEVMKTFNRITYGGVGLPERARIVEIVPADEVDLDAGDTILRLEPA
jgi:acetyl-CoA carboxylase biotin carboxyl carrier protein